MKQTAMIIGSPRYKTSTSYHIAELIQSLLVKEATIYHEQAFRLGQLSFDTLFEYEQLLFLVPLYNDELPANFIAFLELLEIQLHRCNHTISIYAISNAGFLEGMQNVPSIEIIRNFCWKCGCAYKGGIGIGAGSQFNNCSKKEWQSEPNTPVYIAVRQLATCISSGFRTDTIYVQPNITKDTYIRQSNAMWDAIFEKNHMKEDVIWRRIPFIEK